MAYNYKVCAPVPPGASFARRQLLPNQQMKSKSSSPKRSPRGATEHHVATSPDESSPAPSVSTRQQTLELLDCLEAGVLIVSREGRITYANAYARRLFDMPDREPVGLSVQAYEPCTIWEDGSPCRHEDYPPIKCLRTGRIESDATVGLRQPSGGIRWVTVSAVPVADPLTGEPDHAIVTVVDSSHPKHVEDSLRESEDRYRRLVQHAPDCIVVHRGGTILMINNAGVKLYGGRTPADFVGRNVLEFVHHQSREQASRRMWQSLEGQTTPIEVHRHVTLDGKTIYVEVTSTPCVYNGQPAAQVISRDVTRRRSAEREVRRAKAELAQRVEQRTEELSRKNTELQREQRFMERTLAEHERDRQLVAYEIHDTVLQDAIGALMFLDSMTDGSGTQDDVDRLEQARSLLRKCIEGSRRMISGLRPLVIDEQGILGGIEHLVSEFADRGVEIRFRHALVDERLPAELESTLFRIVKEALVNLERHSQATHGEVELSQRDGAIHVEISDHGVGFDPDAVAEGHYGLEGLRERARLAGGAATISSAVGQGTRVVVELPLPAGQLNSGAPDGRNA